MALKWNRNNKYYLPAGSISCICHNRKTAKNRIQVSKINH